MIRLITSLGYERGYLEWGVAYLFPWKGQTKLRFNLNSPSYKDFRRHWRFYIGDISHEEIDCQIFRLAGRKAWKGWHEVQMGTMARVPKRIPIESILSYNGFLTDYAIRKTKKRRRRVQRKRVY